MQTIVIPPDFSAWRDQARSLLEDRVPPEAVLWSDTGSGQDELFSTSSSPAPSVRVRETDPVSVPKPFLVLANAVACHRAPERWGLLYRLLWRVTRENRHLLLVATDDDVRRASAMAKEVQRDVHKMRAFVRFRKVGETEADREQFVAWFEPFHHIVRRNASFFRDRFTGMDWSILTPEECAHWDGTDLHFTPGVVREAAPDGDELEDLWRSYYRSIFNPARLKLKAMQAEMPVKYWKNLPEAPLIRELTSAASTRRDSMIARPALEPKAAPRNLYLQKLEERNQTGFADGPDPLPSAEDRWQSPNELPPLAEMAEQAACCRACPLWERATRTVFGTGNPEAEIMIVGEQPGDREDLEGTPFVGPAGQLLDEALAEAGLRREDLYLTNAVKHFKWKPPAGGAGARGPRRLHDKANRAEMQACRPWLLGEIAKVQPRVIITLGNTSAQTLTDAGFRIRSDRGEITDRVPFPFEGRVFATVHPSFLLRIRDAEERRFERLRFVADLAAAAAPA